MEETAVHVEIILAGTKKEIGPAVKLGTRKKLAMGRSVEAQPPKGGNVKRGKLRILEAS